MIIRKILVAIGGHDYSRNALTYAILLAKKFGAEIRGICVVDIRMLKGTWLKTILPRRFAIGKDTVKKALRLRAEGVKKYFLGRCRGEGIKCSFKIKIGLVSDVIINESRNADLIVIGKRGEHASWLRRHLGSACTRIIHNVNKPVLIVSHIEPRKIRKVLLCYSGGFFAYKELSLARQFVQKDGIELTVFTVSTKKTRAIAVQKEAKRYFDSDNIKAKYLMSIGAVEKEIIKITRIEHIDMLITGVSLEKSYEDFLSICLANRVLFDSNIPVLFVR